MRIRLFRCCRDQVVQGRLIGLAMSICPTRKDLTGKPSPLDRYLDRRHQGMNGCISHAVYFVEILHFNPELIFPPHIFLKYLNKTYV